jgi:hypothetical protein
VLTDTERELVATVLADHVAVLEEDVLAENVGVNVAEAASEVDDVEETGLIEDVVDTERTVLGETVLVLDGDILIAASDVADKAVGSGGTRAGSGLTDTERELVATVLADHVAVLEEDVLAENVGVKSRRPAKWSSTRRQDYRRGWRNRNDGAQRETLF